MISDVVRTKLLDLAIGCRVLALYGHEDKNLGHLSMRDPDGRGLWLKRAGAGLAEIEGPEDFTLIDFDGRKLHGDGVVHMEWPIHTEIMLARPRINVVGHTHPFYGCLFAATEEKLVGFGHEGCYFGHDVPRYRGTSYLIDTQALGRDLAAALGVRKAVLMNNHGVVFCGENVAVAGTLGITLEKACRQQITLAATGFRTILPPEEEVKMKEQKLASVPTLERFWTYYMRMLARYESGHGKIVPLQG
ncbi:class II aldolase/adducin family protein [Roseiarcaceae bacterium H3SJ34-1]|uniref:class II aldolase/adducin family protein n=1 Tax=Terripilifer ovatus TaxID=3032367 RepID=UPI003AB92306|nr:class II aldolase/adducin family protein [Roseiarcaceae bacterium H3SJ34-1]